MKQSFKNNRLYLLGIVIFLELFSCSKVGTPINFRQYISYETHESLSASICLWKNNKQAAYTIAFDDVRPSHYLISEPELYNRKIVGTFNLNTANVSDWKHWKEVAAQGHELASHTVHHVKLTELSDDSIRWELEQSKKIIEVMVPENGPVLSFANPYGLGTNRVKSFVKLYYLSERDSWGINDSSMTPDQLYDVKGVGVYPPFDPAKLEQKVELALKNRGWILVYFHTVTENPDTSDMCQCPLDFFTNHLNFVQSKRDSFWIAPQRDVAKYIVARTGATVELIKLDTFRIGIRVKNVVNRSLSDLIVSVRIKFPTEWIGKNLDIRDESGDLTEKDHLQRETVLNLKLNKLYIFKGFQL